MPRDFIISGDSRWGGESEESTLVKRSLFPNTTVSGSFRL